MAGHHIVSAAVLVTCLTLCVHQLRAQTNVSNEASEEHPPPSGPSQEESLENSVFSEMLRIVDQKFDSLSARISVLERSINSLNFYSVRQFRETAKSIEESTEATERLRTQITKLDADDRTLKAAVSQVGRDINGIKKNMGVINVGMNEVRTDVDLMMVTLKDFRGNSEKMLDDIATSIVYLNENTKQKSEELREVMERSLEAKLDAVASHVQENRAALQRSFEELEASNARSSSHPATNCSVNFRPLEERLDKKFAELKHQSQNYFLELLSAEKEEEEEEAEEQKKQTGSDMPPSRSVPGPPPEHPSSLKSGSAIGRSRVASYERGRARWADKQNGEDYDGGSPGEARAEGGRGDGEKVMRLLANMTRNVMDAVTYFRHTGQMMERLLSNTETVAREQTRLRYDMLEAGGILSEGAPEELRDQQFSNASDPHPEDEEFYSNSVERATQASPANPAPAKGSSHTPPGSFKPRRFNAAFRHGGQGLNSPPSRAGPHAGLSGEKSLAVLAELARNGTLLLDVLTDLAQLSSSSLTKAVGSLHEEVVRLEDVRARLNEGLLLPGKAAAAAAAAAAASSSSNPAGGPGASLNPNGARGELAGLHNTTKTIFTIVEAIASNTGWIPYIFHNMQQVERLTNKTLELAKRSLLSVHMNRGLVGSKLPEDPLTQPDGAGDRAAPSQAEALDVIYTTNVQLLRILPALTRLVAEPEPLIALGDGGSSREGRVEVFYKGQWGSLCSDSLGHEEAQALCRHLGHVGGIWTGDDHHFGRSTEGRYWHLNASCLDAQQLCPFLVISNDSIVECPSGPFAIICDHMLKLTPVQSDAINDDDNHHHHHHHAAHTGMLSLHHHGRWLPVCGHGWSGYEARVACKQMGYQDGRELSAGEVGDDWPQRLVGAGRNVTSWVAGVSCTGEEIRLDACTVDSFQAEACSDEAAPAAVRCQ